MKAVWRTDTGRVRPNNQDFILGDEERSLFLLADGLGGHNAGEVASALAIKTAHDFLAERLDLLTDDAGIPDLLVESICRAHDAVKDMAGSGLRFHGMGTTLIEACIRGNAAYICHAGDSRAYVCSSGLELITKDHTVGSSLSEDRGKVFSEASQRMRHVLTQAVGIRECPLPDSIRVMLRQGDILMLCSDGLTNMLTDDEINRIICSHRGELDRMADMLVSGANSRGGVDNISVMLVER